MRTKAIIFAVLFWTFLAYILGYILLNFIWWWQLTGPKPFIEL